MRKLLIKQRKGGKPITSRLRSSANVLKTMLLVGLLTLAGVNQAAAATYSSPTFVSSNGNNYPDKLCDGIINSKWCDDSSDGVIGGGSGRYIIMDAGSAKRLVAYKLYAGDDTHQDKYRIRRWKTWDLYGSNSSNTDGAWTLIDQVDNAVTEIENFAPSCHLVDDASTAYRYYKLVLKKCYGGGNHQMGEIQFCYEDDMTTVSSGSTPIAMTDWDLYAPAGTISNQGETNIRFGSSSYVFCTKNGSYMTTKVKFNNATPKDYLLSFSMCLPDHYRDGLVTATLTDANGTDVAKTDITTRMTVTGSAYDGIHNVLFKDVAAGEYTLKVSFSCTDESGDNTIGTCYAKDFVLADATDTQFLYRRGMAKGSYNCNDGNHYSYNDLNGNSWNPGAYQYPIGGDMAPVGDRRGSTNVKNVAFSAKQLICNYYEYAMEIPSYSKLVVHASYTLYARNNALYHGASLYAFDTEDAAKSTVLDCSNDQNGTKPNSFIQKIYQTKTDGTEESASASNNLAFDNSTGSADKTMSKWFTFMHVIANGNSSGTNGNRYLNALWTLGKSSADTWTYYKIITFDANGGTGTSMANQTIENSGSLTANTYTRTGYVFTGWNTEADGSGIAYNNGATITATSTDKGPVTLYAQWSRACKNTTTNIEYGSLQEAINDVGDGQTIQMLANTTEKITCSKRFTLDLNGFVLNQSTNDNGVIVSSGNLTIKDSNARNTHYFTYISNGAWIYKASHTPAETDVALADIGTATLVSGETVISVPGGCITGGKAYGFGGGVKINGGSVTLQSGNIIGNSVPSGPDECKGGGVCVYGGTFNMQGGVIAGNHAYTGGGVQTNNSTTLDMTGGKIISNYGGLGGGVNNDGTIIMTGGEIAYNTGYHGGGGVRDCGYNTVGGTARIINNTSDGVNANNFLMGSVEITVSTGTPLINGAHIGVTAGTTPTAGNPVAVTSNCALSDLKYFKSDNASYATIYKDSKVKLALIGSNVCQIVETGTMYTTVKDAFNAVTTGQTVQLLKNTDLTTLVDVVDGKNFILDLNGYRLNQTSATERIFNVKTGAVLNITDSRPEGETHYFTVGTTKVGENSSSLTEVQRWTLNTVATSGIDWKTLTARPETGGIIAVKGGIITGGYANDNYNGNYLNDGGAIYSEGTVNMNAGTIVGNTASRSGGAIFSSKGTINISGTAALVGNTANQGGASYNQNTTFTMTDDSRVSFNSTGSEGGGVWFGGTGNFSGNSVISYNKTTITDGDGGGVWFEPVDGNMTIGGTLNITNNKKGDAANNLYLKTGKTITVSSTTPLTNGANIGVLTETAPTAGKPVAVTTQNDADYSQYFTSDNAAYYIANDDNVVKLIAVETLPETLETSTYPGIYTISTTSTIPYGVTVTLTGDIINSTKDNFIIKDGGKLITTRTINATVEKHISKSTITGTTVSGWSIFGSPVNEQIITEVTDLIPDQSSGNSYEFFRFDNKYYMKEWQNYKSTDYQNHTDFTYTDNTCRLEAGRGYLYANTQDGGSTLLFKGTIYGESVVREKLDNGFNLLCNPFTQDITSTNISLNDGSFTGLYKLVNDKWVSCLDEAISPMEGFLIQVNATGNPDITFSKTPASKRSSESDEYIEISVSNAKHFDRAYAIFGGDGYLTKIEHRNAEAPMLYIPQYGQDYAIASMGETTTEFPVSFEAKTTGKYVIRVSNSSSFNRIRLIDSETGADIDMLAEGKYEFVGSPVDNENRFTIRLDKISESEHFAYQIGSELVINGEGTLQIIDVLGRVVVSDNVSGKSRVSTSLLNTGAYIIRITGDDVKTQKIVIK